MQRKTDLPGQFGEREIVGFVERERSLRTPDDDQTEQLAGVRDGRGAEHWLFETGEDRGQPHLRPRGTGHSGVRDHRLLFGAERNERGALVGNGNGPFDAVGTPGPHFRDLEVHRGLERLRELEQQLVERERAR